VNRFERAADVLNPQCRCEDVSGTYCRVHDRESGRAKPGDMKRLMNELRELVRPWDELYANLWVLGYTARPFPKDLEGIKPAEDAWLSGVDWAVRDAGFYRVEAAKVQRSRRRRPRRGGRGGFLRRLLR